MNVSHRYRCVFIHLPKTGGKSIRALDWWDEHTGHFPLFSEMEVPAGYTTFTVVRHPADRLLSGYSMFDQQPMFQQVVRLEPWESWILEFPTWKLRGDLTFWPMGQLLGPTSPDVVLRFESLQSDWDDLCRRLGAPGGPLPRRNTSQHPPWPEAFADPRAREIVRTIYRDDLERFGYRI